jgi:hypothetical protein
VKFFVFGLLLYAAAAEALHGRQEEALWMPEGYRLLSAEERQGLSAEALKDIQTRNTTLLREAIHGMTPEERQAMAQSLDAFGRNHELTQVERQYVSMTSMMLLAAVTEEERQKDRDGEQSRFQQLLKEQEATPRAFPSDQRSVEAEAQAIEALIGKEDARRLYLRTLAPLRARPWNDYVRVCFRRIVRGDSHRPGGTSLYDAALAFLRARQSESPDQGSWYSLEGFLRLALRGEVSEAKKLFAAANARGAKDLECRIFPLLLAEMERDAAEVERAKPRALEAWPKPGDLDRVLLENIDTLPSELAARARESFGKKYGRAHPADWPSRVQALASALDDAELKKIHGDASALPAALRAVESETTMLQSLPPSALPEPHRAELFALQLRARAGLGRCEEVYPALTALETEAELAYPRELDPDSPPRPRTAKDVRELKVSIGKERQELSKLKSALDDGSLERVAEWRDVPQEERLRLARDALSEMERAVAEGDSLLGERSESAAAAEWSRRELAEWEKAHDIPSGEYLESYDLMGQAERLGISVRVAEAQCLLNREMLVEAARVLKPCVGGGRNFHLDCIFPLIDAGVALARKGDIREAAAIFNLVEPSSASTEALFVAIESKSPGAVKKKVPVPPKPMPRPPA